MTTDKTYPSNVSELDKQLDKNKIFLQKKNFKEVAQWVRDGKLQMPSFTKESLAPPEYTVDDFVYSRSDYNEVRQEDYNQAGRKKYEKRQNELAKYLFEQFAKRCGDFELTGESILNLTDDDLRSMGIKDPSNRWALLESINHFINQPVQRKLNETVEKLHSLNGELKAVSESFKTRMPEVYADRRKNKMKDWLKDTIDSLASRKDHYMFWKTIFFISDIVMKSLNVALAQNFRENSSRVEDDQKAATNLLLAVSVFLMVHSAVVDHVDFTRVHEICCSVQSTLETILVDLELATSTMSYTNVDEALKKCQAQISILETNNALGSQRGIASFGKQFHVKYSHLMWCTIVLAGIVMTVLATFTTEWKAFACKLNCDYNATNTNYNATNTTNIGDLPDLPVDPPAVVLIGALMAMVLGLIVGGHVYMFFKMPIDKRTSLMDDFSISRASKCGKMKSILCNKRTNENLEVISSIGRILNKHPRFCMGAANGTTEEHFFMPYVQHHTAKALEYLDISCTNLRYQTNASSGNTSKQRAHDGVDVVRLKEFVRDCNAHELYLRDKLQLLKNKINFYRTWIAVFFFFTMLFKTAVMLAAVRKETQTVVIVTVVDMISAACQRFFSFQRKLMVAKSACNVLSAEVERLVLFVPVGMVMTHSDLENSKRTVQETLGSVSKTLGITKASKTYGHKMSGLHFTFMEYMGMVIFVMTLGILFGSHVRPIAGIKWGNHPALALCVSVFSAVCFGQLTWWVLPRDTETKMTTKDDTGDGNVNVFEFDTTKDNNNDILFTDQSGDGQIDCIRIDTTNDGKYDIEFHFKDFWKLYGCARRSRLDGYIVESVRLETPKEETSTLKRSLSLREVHSNSVVMKGIVQESCKLLKNEHVKMRRFKFSLTKDQYELLKKESATEHTTEEFQLQDKKITFEVSSDGKAHKIHLKKQKQQYKSLKKESATELTTEKLELQDQKVAFEVSSDGKQTEEFELQGRFIV